MKTMACPVASGSVAGPGPSSIRRSLPTPTPQRMSSARVQRLTPIRAVDDSDQFENRLKKLVKNAKVPKGDAKVVAVEAPTAGKLSPYTGKKTYDYTDEKVHYEGPPHRGDLAVNIAMGTTLVWLPLTFGAIGRGAFVKYRFTDRRFSIMTAAPWKNEQIDVAYQEVAEVVTVGRGWGAWGDMVVTLRDKSKVELRSLDQFKELKAYILEQRDALAPEYKDVQAAAAGGPVKGVVTAEELMGEEEKPKGFGKK